MTIKELIKHLEKIENNFVKQILFKGFLKEIDLFLLRKDDYLFLDLKVYNWECNFNFDSKSCQLMVYVESEEFIKILKKSVF